MEKCTNTKCDSYEELCNRKVTFKCDKCSGCMYITGETNRIPFDVDDFENMDSVEIEDGHICPTCFHINYLDLEIDIVDERQRDSKFLERSFEDEWSKNGILE